MRVEATSEGVVMSSHLPPVEQSMLLTVGRDRRVKAIEKIETPVNEYGIPDPKLYLGYLAMTLDASYEPPKATNVHHLIHPRLSYARYGRDSIQHKFRETPSLMAEIQVQIHNYGHWVMVPPPMPHLDVMEQYVSEQEQIELLFKIGRGVISTPRWLEELRGEGEQVFRTAEAYAGRYDFSEDAFYDALDGMEDGELGLMPNRQELSDMGLPAAVRLLGTLAGVRYMNYQRESRVSVRRYDLSSEPLRKAA